MRNQNPNSEATLFLSLSNEIDVEAWEYEGMPKYAPGTAWPIGTKLGTEHPWVEGIQVCSNEGPKNNFEKVNYQ